MMSKLKNAEGNTCAVILTYGDRFDFLKQTINGCLKNKVDEILVVENASSEKSRLQLRKEVAQHPGVIKILHLDKNIGSAGGFERGIREIVKNQYCKYILLLDDDNMMLDNCLFSLVDTFEKLEPLYGASNLMLSSNRFNRSGFIYLGGKSIKKGSFLGFRFLSLPEKLIRLLGIKEKNKLNIDKVRLELATAPWGGLFFHRDLVGKFGFPNSEFVLYGADTEFTYRVIKKGGKIFLVPQAKIADVDKGMGGEARLFNIISYITASHSSRVYYKLRNAAYLDIFSKNDKTAIRKINKLIYLTILKILSILYNRRKRFGIIMEAIRDGEQGKLGYNEKYPL